MVNNKIITFFGASGVGKTYLQHYLKQQYQIPMLITHTTRKPRYNEKNGVDYYFDTIKQFKHLDLMESAHYNHNYYGSAYNDIKHLWGRGHHVISATLDYHGVQAYINRLGAHVIPIYLYTNINTVVYRLIHRHMPKVQIKARLNEHYSDLHNIYHVINHAKDSVITIDTTSWKNERNLIDDLVRSLKL